MLTIGVLKEIRNSEGRVGLTPKGVHALSEKGLTVFVESGAGETCGFEDEMYSDAGATILPSPEKLLQNAKLVVKIQSLTSVEAELLNDSHIIFCFQNLNYNAERLRTLIESNAVFFGAEHIEDQNGNYPVLEALSDVSGRIATHIGANLLTATHSGKGILLSGSENIPSAKITVIGAGLMGRVAAVHAWSNGANVTLFGLKPEKIANYDIVREGLTIESFSLEKLEKILPETDILIISVFSLKNPDENFKISKELINMMKPGSVCMDLSIEQNAIVETSHVTTIAQPTYMVNNIIHYSVPNIASTIPVTASVVYTKKILPIIELLAGNGLKNALDKSPEVLSGLLVYKGKVTNRTIADRFKHKFYNIFDLLELNL